jgi:hypothetical protein
MDSLLGVSTRDLGVRFNLVGFLPTALLALFLSAALLSGVPASAPDLGSLEAHLRRSSPLQAALFTVAVLALALVLQPLQLSLVRLLEGYWGRAGWLRIPADWGCDRHRQRRERLAQQTQIPKLHGQQPSGQQVAVASMATWKLRRLYPDDPDHVMPTLLGNVLKAGEDRAGGRYGLDCVVIWPRLYPLLSEPLTAALDDARNQLDLAVRFAATFGLIATGALVLLAPHGWWAAVVLAALALAWLSYRGSVNAAIAYGELLESAIDLHRFDLLQALHLPLPADPGAERTLNTELSDLLRQDLEMQVQYAHASSAESAQDEEPPRESARNRRRRPPTPSPPPARPAAARETEPGIGAGGQS